MMLLDVFLEGLFEMDLRRINSEEVRARHAGFVQACSICRGREP